MKIVGRPPTSENSWKFLDLVTDYTLTNPTDTKTCLFCAETIKAAAIKCQYCGSDLIT